MRLNWIAKKLAEENWSQPGNLLAQMEAKRERFQKSAKSGNRPLYDSDSFTDWLMYKPSGGQWVPLRKISWSWSGTASWDGTKWSTNNLSNPDPAPDVDSTDFPQWTDNIVNHPWQPE